MQTINELKEDIKSLKMFQSLSTSMDTGIVTLILTAIKVFIYTYCETSISVKESKIQKLEKDEFEKTQSDKEKDKLGKIKL